MCKLTSGTSSNMPLPTTRRDAGSSSPGLTGPSGRTRRRG